MQLSSEGSVSPKSVSRCIWAKGYNFSACQAKTVLKLVANKKNMECGASKKHVCHHYSSQPNCVCKPPLFVSKPHSFSCVGSVHISDFCFAATKFVVCWMDTRFKAHMKTTNQWYFYLKQRKKKSPWLLLLAQLSQLLQDINSDGFLAMFAQNVCFHITLSCKLGYAAAFEITWDHKIPLAGIPRRVKKQGDRFSDCSKEIIIEYIKYYKN